MQRLDTERLPRVSETVLPAAPASLTPRRPALLREQAFIGGRWINAEQHFDILDPATGQPIGSVPALSSDEVTHAIAAASFAQRAWRDLLPQQRADRLLAWHDAMIAAREDLALLLTLEQGKSLAEARGEIDYGASFVRWFAEEGRRLGGETLASHLPDRRLHTVREPVGVVACVTPWNFPSAMLARKASAALAAGCAVVAAPSMETPFSALALAALADAAGLPPGLLNVITGEPETIVGALCEHPGIAALSFTGSTRTGRMLAGRCAARGIRTQMELGGNAPFLAFADVPLDELVAAALEAKFQTSGQDCLAADRMLVEASIHDDFVAAFTAGAARLRLGTGFDADAALNPLIHVRAGRAAHRLVTRAVDAGARLHLGGAPLPCADNWFPATVLSDVTPDMDLWRQESFAPIAAIAAFDSESEALTLANATDYGLAAYVFTRDARRLARLGDALDFGMVALNCVGMTGAPVPFGGRGASGDGREGGRAGIEAFTHLKYLCQTTA